MSDMKPTKQPFFDDPVNVKWILRVFYAICVILVAMDFIVHRHVYMSWESLPTFYPLYGFVACVVLVVIAKEMRKVLMRKEDYYSTEENEGGEQDVDR